MAFRLRDIIDLEFFLALDEKGEAENEAALSARDRDIGKQIGPPYPDDAGLIREWLSYRKLLFFHESAPGEILPGTLFASLLGWAGKLLFAGGAVLGLTSAYSFLAYHGSRPVNVTLFIFFFILLQALISLASLGVMAGRVLSRKQEGFRAPFQALVSGLFFKKLGQAWEQAVALPGGRALSTVKDIGALLGTVHKAHDRILFWSFFRQTSLFALGFCCGALAATLFRVTVTDLAFGWESTLVSSGVQVHNLIAWIARPWSWILPKALPGPEQIEGSRIILKEGIAGLASRDLAAWWPFLCMGILVYGVMLRLLVAVAAGIGQAAALARIDTDHPRFRRLLVRMRTPRMETQARDESAAPSVSRPPLPRPDPEPDACGNDTAAPGPAQDTAGLAGLHSLMLASRQAYPEDARGTLVSLVEAQLGVRVKGVVDISFDADRDRAVLEAAAGSLGQAPVIVLQEVWQPPIRGLLYYFSRIKSEIFPRNPLWIVLTRTPGEGAPGVTAEDMNYRVWKKAVSQLNSSGIVLERILP